MEQPPINQAGQEKPKSPEEIKKYTAEAILWMKCRDTIDNSFGKASLISVNGMSEIKMRDENIQVIEKKPLTWKNLDQISAGWNYLDEELKKMAIVVYPEIAYAIIRDKVDKMDKQNTNIEM
jgi:hypothetical protein